MDWQTNCKDLKRPRDLMFGKNETRLIEKQDLIHIAILMAIALVIGVYLIVTTVLIAKDGVFYIERAQRLSSDPVDVIKEHPPGYPFLISIAHRFVVLLSKSSSVYTWIYSAQSATLLCRLLALIPLYFTGKLLVGGHKSFWGILVLVMLPYSAEIGCDVVREWLYILFLATGFMLLLWDSGRISLRVFLLVGVVSGIGCLNREESSQLYLYGLAWLIFCLVRPGKSVSRRRVALAMLMITCGFMVIAVPYDKVKGNFFSGHLKPFRYSLSNAANSETFKKDDAVRSSENRVQAGLTENGVVHALGSYVNSICKITLYVFALPLATGFYFHFRRMRWSDHRKFLIGIFTLFTFVLFLLLYCQRGRNSERHVLPLLAVVIVYVPTGMQVIAGYFSQRCKRGTDAPRADDSARRWFVVLMAIGLVVCLPKLLRPIRSDKLLYRQASAWLKKNTPKEASIVEPDCRISFYAERKGLKWNSEKIPKKGDYAVKIFKSPDETPPLTRRGVLIQERLRLDARKGAKRLVIYEIIRE